MQGYQNVPRLCLSLSNREVQFNLGFNHTECVQERTPSLSSAKSSSWGAKGTPSRLPTSALISVLNSAGLVHGGGAGGDGGGGGVVTRPVTWPSILPRYGSTSALQI